MNFLRFFFGPDRAVYTVIMALIGKLKNSAPYSLQKSLLSIITPGICVPFTPQTT
jgi:hypothetical protein